MKTLRTISVLLALTILTGSVPYSYAYCVMMKRALDSAMQLRCNARAGALPSRQAHALDSNRSMMRLVSKSTTDSYERLPDASNGHAPVLTMLVDAPALLAAGTSPYVPLDAAQPPPDIVIEILNLRI